MNGQRRKLAIARLDLALPFRASGVMMRAMGRLDNDSSPPIVVTNGCAARIPDSIRMVEPELPASSAAEGSRNPSTVPMDADDTVLSFVFRAQRPHARERRLAIGAGGIIRYRARPFGDPRQHRIAV